MKTENKAVQPTNDPRTGRIDKGPQGIVFAGLINMRDKYAFAPSNEQFGVGRLSFWKIWTEGR